MVEKVNESEYKEIISNSYVLVDFYADWCGPCKMMGRVIDDLANEIDYIKFIKVNVDEESKVASELGIVSIPTVMIFKSGILVKKIVGFTSKSELKSYIDENI